MSSTLYNILVTTKAGITAELTDIKIEKGQYDINLIKIILTPKSDYLEIKVVPPDGDVIVSIRHRATVDAKNFHQVIHPDSGRNYPSTMQLVNFWASRFSSTYYDIKAPIFILTGQDHFANWAFGIVGKDYETDFRCVEPKRERALQHHYRRVTLEVSRGFDGYPIPEEIYEDNLDNSVCEGIYIRNFNENDITPWIGALREFSNIVKREYNIKFVCEKAAMEPLWCSWTDWLSSDISEELILENAKEGIKMGITNYIIDDGWFGPGLDSDFNTTIDFGDWNAEGTRFKDIKGFSNSIRKLGGRSIIWCAPHTITSVSEIYRKNYKYLMKDETTTPILTHNKLNLYCVKCPEGREIMADICARLATEYETDGAKYDLFNLYPNDLITQCQALDHRHDVSSNILGLQLLLKRIWEKVREANPKYIVELKQNYGWVFLSQFGSMVRAGDTPYNPEGNFMRTAFVQAYNQYAINDYQTITNFDTVEESAIIVIKMISVGIPTYSMDMVNLSDNHKNMLKFYNGFYLNFLKENNNFDRVPLDGDLGVWYHLGKNSDTYFCVNNGNIVPISIKKDFSVLNGSIFDEIIIKPEIDITIEITFFDCMGNQIGIQIEDIKKEDSKFISIKKSGMISAKVL